MSGTSDGSVSENNLTIHNQSTVNQTFHRTFGRDTVEVVPMEHYYRNADTLRSVNRQGPAPFQDILMSVACDVYSFI